MAIHKVLGDEGIGKLWLTPENISAIGDPKVKIQGIALEAAFHGLSHLRVDVAYIHDSIYWRMMMCEPETPWVTLRRWKAPEILLPFIERLSCATDFPLGTEADYLVFPLNRQEPCTHWVLAALDLHARQFTLFDSCACNDKYNRRGKAEILMLQEYFDYLIMGEVDKKIKWKEPIFPGKRVPQQYDPKDRGRLLGIDCGLFCVFYAIALGHGGHFGFSQEDMPVLRQRVVQLAVDQTASALGTCRSERTEEEEKIAMADEES